MFVLIVAWCMTGPQGDSCRAEVAPVYYGRKQDCIAGQVTALQAAAMITGPDQELIWISMDCERVSRRNG